MAELCSTYDLALGHNLCGMAAANLCLDHLAGESAVPAAVVLYTLLSQVWRKPVSWAVSRAVVCL